MPFIKDDEKYLKASAEHPFVCVADNKVPDYIETKIVGVQFEVMGEKTTVCLLKLENGFEVVGTSACVDPSHFSHYAGQRWSAKQALDKLEELDAFLRQSRL